jgi:predicted metalloprotease with PDZ domain
VTIAKEAKDLWRTAPCTGTLTVVAEVYAFDFSVRTAYLDALRGYFNGPSVSSARKAVPKRRARWRSSRRRAPRFALARSRPRCRARAPPWGFGAYRAANYDELIDHPVEMARFPACVLRGGRRGARHRDHGQGPRDLDRLTTDLGRICQWHIDLFGGAQGCRAPFDRYLFQIAAVGDGYGGLEHRTSTSLCCKRDELPAPGLRESPTTIGAFSASRAMNIFTAGTSSGSSRRRSRPTTSRARITRASCGRSKASPPTTTTSRSCAAASSIPKAISSSSDRTSPACCGPPGRHVQSLADSSFDAWIKFYRRDENTPNAVVSYYAKGALVALALDLTLRNAGASLDDLMRVLWQRHGETGTGVPEDGVEAVAAELAGANLSDFFARYVHGTEDPPLATLLGGFGVKLNLRPRKVIPIAAASPAAMGPTTNRPPRGSGPAWRRRRGDAATCLPGRAGGTRGPRRRRHRRGDRRTAGFRLGDRKAAPRRRVGETLTVHAFRRDE